MCCGIFAKMTKSVLLGLLVCLGGGVVVRASPGQEAYYTPKELKALERLKPLVIPKIPASSLVQNYKSDDLYWVQWLRFKNLDVRGAERLFLEHLKWREDMKMDTILDEDWTAFESDFPLYCDGVSKDGKPVAELLFSDWKVRTGVVAGKMKKLQRYAATLFEVTSRRLYEARASGKNVSQGIALCEAEGFNLIEQGCPTCLPLYAAMTVQLEHHYPNIFETMNVINMPPSFDIILKVVLPIMRPVTRKSIKSYPDKNVWMPVLDGMIDRSQRFVVLGGTKVLDS